MIQAPEPLTAEHSLGGFDSGVSSLDDWLRRRALRNQASGKTRTDFILSAARRAAEEELLDRTIFVVSPSVFAKFLAMLDAPPKPNERLRRTMKATPSWSKA